MFCFKRIIAFLAIWLILFTFVSCDKAEEFFLAISKVELTTNLYYEEPHLELYLFSSNNCSKIKLKEHKLIKEVTGYKNNVKLVDKDKVWDGFLHLFYITFEKEEFILQKLTFICLDQEIEVNIGMYQSLLLEPSTIDIHTSINIYQDQDLIGLLNINNKLDNPIYFLEQRVVTLKKQQLLEPFVIDKFIVHSDKIKSLDIFSINPKEKYHQIGGIVQTRFKTNLDEYIIYTSYYYSNMFNLNYLSSTGIEISSLEVIKNS